MLNVSPGRSYMQKKTQKRCKNVPKTSQKRLKNVLKTSLKRPKNHAKSKYLVLTLKFNTPTVDIKINSRNHSSIRYKSFQL